MKKIDLNIKFYGAFRKFGQSISVKVNSGANMIDVKNALISALGEDHYLLVGDSVLANDEAILPNDYVISEESTLSILPPVCGG